MEGKRFEGAPTNPEDLKKGEEAEAIDAIENPEWAGPVRMEHEGLVVETDRSEPGKTALWTMKGNIEGRQIDLKAVALIEYSYHGLERDFITPVFSVDRVEGTVDGKELVRGPARELWDKYFPPFEKEILEKRKVPVPRLIRKPKG